MDWLERSVEQNINEIVALADVNARVRIIEGEKQADLDPLAAALGAGAGSMAGVGAATGFAAPALVAMHGAYTAPKGRRFHGAASTLAQTSGTLHGAALGGLGGAGLAALLASHLGLQDNAGLATIAAGGLAGAGLGGYAGNQFSRETNPGPKQLGLEDREPGTDLDGKRAAAPVSAPPNRTPLPDTRPLPSWESLARTADGLTHFSETYANTPAPAMDVVRDPLRRNVDTRALLEGIPLAAAARPVSSASRMPFPDTRPLPSWQALAQQATGLLHSRETYTDMLPPEDLRHTLRRDMNTRSLLEGAATKPPLRTPLPDTRPLPSWESLSQQAKLRPRPSTFVRDVDTRSLLEGAAKPPVTVPPKSLSGKRADFDLSGMLDSARTGLGNAAGAVQGAVGKGMEAIQPHLDNLSAHARPMLNGAINWAGEHPELAATGLGAVAGGLGGAVLNRFNPDEDEHDLLGSAAQGAAIGGGLGLGGSLLSRHLPHMISSANPDATPVGDLNRQIEKVTAETPSWPVETAKTLGSNALTGAGQLAYMAVPGPAAAAFDTIANDPLSLAAPVTVAGAAVHGHDLVRRGLSSINQMSGTGLSDNVAHYSAGADKLLRDAAKKEVAKPEGWLSGLFNRAGTAVSPAAPAGAHFGKTDDYQKALVALTQNKPITPDMIAAAGRGQNVTFDGHTLTPEQMQQISRNGAGWTGRANPLTYELSQLLKRTIGHDFGLGNRYAGESPILRSDIVHTSPWLARGRGGVMPRPTSMLGRNYRALERNTRFGGLRGLAALVTALAAPSLLGGNTQAAPAAPQQ